ncbi:hypothetical protein CRUP_024585 [Coryphaenoides rupestris]|nr:hypothetical protein CRUP_024585 [Coryphaenoides rupestris]
MTHPGCVYGSCSEPWQCVCDVNWGGLLCDKDLNTCGNHQPCQNGGTCSNTEPNEYQCECQEGFRGRNCDIAVRQCDLSPCGRGATCQESPEGFRCLCPPGWMGRTCQLDTNECEVGICVNARSCRNLIGGYLCDCLPGWSGPNCDIRNSSCHGLCLSGGRCKDLASGSKCICLSGFTGKYCQTVASACDSTPCLNGGQCVEGDEQGPICNCLPGYSGSFCEVMLDLCNPNPCQQGVPCRTFEGRYMCACPDGFYTNKCLSVIEPCIGQHCPGAVSDTVRGGGLSFYMVLVGVSALVTVCCCAACAFLLSHLHRRRKRKQTQGAPQAPEAINNQREFVTLIRNVERPFPLLPPPPPPTSASSHRHDPPSRCRHEEIELTLPPPSPAPSRASPAAEAGRPQTRHLQPGAGEAQPISTTQITTRSWRPDF